MKRKFRVGQIVYWEKHKIKILNYNLLAGMYNGKEQPCYQVAFVEDFIKQLKVFPLYAKFWLWQDQLRK